jgi:CheY-like chemotaxis protein/ferredoxin
MPETAAVLVVDDERVVRESCERVLRGDGQTVTCASDGLEGLEKCRSAIFDVVLVDLKMPGLDGMDLLRSIRDEKPELQVVILTGYSTVATATEAMKMGAFDYVTKPFTPDELCHVVREALKHKRSGLGPASLEKCRVMTCDELPRFVQRLLSNFEVWGPKDKGGSVAFDRIGSASELALDYSTTILPPKKLFYPQRQTLMRYSMGTTPTIRIPEKDSQQRVVMGIHPCDLHALRILDVVLTSERDDPVYRGERKRTLVVGVDCEPQDSCFCSAMDANEPPQGTDLFLRPLDGRFLVEMGSPAGERLLGEYADTMDATAGDISAVRHFSDRKRGKIGRSLDRDEIGEIVHNRFDDDVWGEIAEKCLGCGSCSLVCPTCYCFNVLDSVSLDLSNGRRHRVWDSCILQDFALVAGPHNFRATRASRMRSWYYHKFRGLRETHGLVGCVGCGRCIRSCPAGIEITEVVKTLEITEAVKTLQGGSNGDKR